TDGLILIVTKALSLIARKRVESIRPKIAGVVVVRGRLLRDVSGVRTSLCRFCSGAFLDVCYQLSFSVRSLSLRGLSFFFPGRILGAPGRLTLSPGDFIFRGSSGVV